MDVAAREVAEEIFAEHPVAVMEIVSPGRTARLIDGVDPHQGGMVDRRRNRSGRSDSGQLVLAVESEAPAALRREIALRIMGRSRAAVADELVQPVDARARASRAVAGPGVGVVRGGARGDLARRAVAECERQVVRSAGVGAVMKGPSG